ncbi:hypothetical protein [Amnibacterium setariae]|uniref:Uncharacterized protein n=1 Tax=Amnibacterium setariae TaxID=2306585 RepID=A0A3A1U5I2_9MICO|nr:hypothetical protein [Amnibacterium setariae]RIX30268.1 hypothetical protein D1781_02165 [Amnibacterium setariae]
MSSIIQFLTSEDISRRRDALVREAGADLEELRLRRDQGLLDFNKLGLLDELEDLEYLDGDR